MIKLFLDDIRNPPDDTWTVARTAEEAQRLLSEQDVDMASLDHDLGECSDCAAKRGYEDPRFTCPHRMNGYRLTLWMAETGHWPRQKPTVHSANPVGAANMRATIDRYWAPRESETR